MFSTTHSQFQNSALEDVLMMSARINARVVGLVIGPIIGCRVFRFVSHVHSLSVRSLAMVTKTGTDFPISGSVFPNQEMELPFPFDISTDQGAYDAARAMCRRLVMVTQQDAKTVDASIQSISRRYRFGTFIENLWKGKKATITLAKFVRLRRALSSATRFQAMQAQHDEMFQRQLERKGF